VKRIQGFLLFLFVAGCVEPYDFAIKNNEPSLVVEAYVSDKSFAETVNYPSDGRYFTVKLTTTTDVTNIRPRPVVGAHVQLLNGDGEVWEYSESANQPGSYLLVSTDFKAEVGVYYKLRIKLPDESAYESDWETLPTELAPAMGQISFREESIQKYIVESNKEVLVSVKGMWTDIAIPENTTGEPLYYRWTYKPHWIFVAPFASVIDPGHTCWATNPLSVQNYALQLDRTGNYNKDLFFMETVRNARIFVRYSSLIIQHAMTEKSYTFWKEMQEQNEGGAIFDKPPFNLHTNFHSLTGDKKVSGYFGVVQEQARRWYFDKRDLSYYVENTLRKDCSIPFLPPAPECFDCREYSFGIATNVKPQWWED
jgi:Domain of unknown function (DUF4249)